MKPLSVWQIQVLRYVFKAEPSSELVKWFYQRTIYSLIERGLVTVDRGALVGTPAGTKVVMAYTTTTPRKKKTEGLSPKVARAFLKRRAG